MSLARFSISRPVSIIMITLCLLVLGAFSISQLPVDFLPRIIYPRIIVIVDYPGVNPTVIEEEVTKVLERELATTDGITKIYSVAAQGFSLNYLFFELGRDVDLALQDTITKVNLARRNLPKDIDPPRIFKFDPAQMPILEFSLSSRTLSGTALRTWADEQLSRELMVVQGVASVEVLGGRKEEVQVVVDFPRLRNVGVTISDVLRRLREENQEVSGGRLIGESGEFQSRTLAKFQSAQDLERVIFHNVQGQKVYLKDFAKVVDAGERQRIFAWLNNAESIKVVVLKQQGTNTVAVANAVRERLNFMKAHGLFPPDTELKPIFDQSWFIQNSLSDVSFALLLGGGLATLVILLFLGSLRRTLVIALSIPITLMVTFLIMRFSGLTLNIFSLGGLALAVGTIVDSAIVILENIARHQKLTSDPIAASSNASREVESALVASTATNLAALLPFLFIGGMVSLLFKELILTISFVWICALLLALSLTPMLAARLLAIPRTSGLSRTFLMRSIDRGTQGLTRTYGRLLGVVLRFPLPVVLGIMGAFVLVLPLYLSLGSEILPAVDDHRATISVRFPPGRPLAENIAVLKRLGDLVGSHPEVKENFTVAGGRLFGRGVRQDPTVGSLDLELDPRVKTADFIDRLRPKIEELKIPDVRIFVHKSRVRGLNVSHSTHQRDLGVKVRGEDLDILNRVAAEAIRALRTVPGLINVDRNVEEAEPEFRIEVDRERAAELGLSAEEIGQTVRTAVEGVVATKLTRGDRQVDVRVQYSEALIQREEDLENLSLFPRDGSVIPLRHVAKVKRGFGPASITREDQSRMVEIVGDVRGKSLGEVAADVRERLKAIPLPPGYAFIPGGEEEALAQTQRTLAILALLAVFLVYAVLAVQYESFANPFVIILTVPLAIMGSILGLYFTGIPMGATVLVGIIMLVGIVVNNAILIVEYTVQLRRDHGMERTPAIIRASSLRLRPILMTSLTTVFAVLPLALGGGEGSEMMRPLGIVMASGLSLATFLTLFLTPSVYALVDDASAWLRSRVLGAPVPTDGKTIAVKGEEALTPIEELVAQEKKG